MPPSPRTRQRSTALVAAVALAAACRSHREPRHDAAATPPPPPPADAAGTPVDAAPENRITISIAPPREPGTGFARRCVLGGDPLTSDCVGGAAGIAIASDGTLFVAAADGIHRYTRAAGDDCRFEPAGAVISLPPANSRPQKLDGGPVYMRSGGPAWHLVRAGSAIYAYDFLAGLYRMDRGKPEPACVDVFGYDSVAARGGQLVVARNGIERLALAGGGRCKAQALIADKGTSRVWTIGEELYAANRAFELSRYDGTSATRIAEGARICSVAAVTGCGDGACAIDNNCMQVVQLGADGKVLRVLEDARLFDERPWSLEAAVTAKGGDVFVLARHRDRARGHDICETAIYRLPAALFEL